MRHQIFKMMYSLKISNNQLKSLIWAINTILLINQQFSNHKQEVNNRYNRNYISQRININSHKFKAISMNKTNGICWSSTSRNWTIWIRLQPIMPYKFNILITKISQDKIDLISTYWKMKDHKVKWYSIPMVKLTWISSQNRVLWPITTMAMVLLSKMLLQMNWMKLLIWNNNKMLINSKIMLMSPWISIKQFQMKKDKSWKCKKPKQATYMLRLISSTLVWQRELLQIVETGLIKDSVWNRPVSLKESRMPRKGWMIFIKCNLIKSRL